MTDTGKADAASNTSLSQANKEQRVTPGAGKQLEADTATDQRLGPSSHVGQPRGYAENAVDSLDDDSHQEKSSAPKIPLQFKR